MQNEPISSRKIQKIFEFDFSSSNRAINAYDDNWSFSKKILDLEFPVFGKSFHS